MLCERREFEESLLTATDAESVKDLGERLKQRASAGTRDEVIGVLVAAEVQGPDLVEGVLNRDNDFLAWLRAGEGGGSSGAAAAPARAARGDQDEREELEEVEDEAGQEAKDAAPATASGGIGSDLPLLDPGELSARLMQRVVGQDHIVDRLVRRLAVTRAELDKRPERPDAAFLFAGPTGVGKTEMAKALAEEVLGDESALIRLDMSEYSHDWAVSRLTGPMQGYVGSDQPQSWLTTKIRKKPESVLLLDEIEKAHPVVWSVFLQAFDAGRLTDSRGKVADFSRVIIIMTSNLGAEAYNTRSLGFGDRESEEEVREETEASGLQEKIAKILPPELFNRLDGVLAFRALEKEDILRISDLEVEQLLERLKERGIELELPEDVRQHLAESHYDRRYGARHLQRNIESLLVEPIAYQGITEGPVSARLDGEEIVVEAG